jgi:hypothetical protein
MMSGSQICNIINDDATKKGSQVVLLATTNQFLYPLQGATDLVSQREVSILAQDAASAREQLAREYGVDPGDITWDTMTQCKSINSPALDGSGQPMIDAGGNIVPGYWNRQSLAQIGRASQAPIYVAWAPFESSALMQQATQYVPLRYDYYIAPEALVIFIIVAVALLSYWLLKGDTTSEPQYYS